MVLTTELFVDPVEALGSFSGPSRLGSLQLLNGQVMSFPLCIYF